MYLRNGAIAVGVAVGLFISNAPTAKATMTTPSIQTVNIAQSVQVSEHSQIDVTNVSITGFGVELEDVKLKPKPVILEAYGVPNEEEGCRSYNLVAMAYQKVTAVNSNQYALLNSDKAYTDMDTGLRMYDGRYCIAVGTYYAIDIGTKINVTMANGSVFECILGDVKSDAHTDETHRYHAVDGSVVEMIMDEDVFESTSQYPEGLRGNVVKIEIVK